MVTYHGALHVHSTYSYDGKLSLPALKQFFITHGIQFVCMSEHTDELTPEAAINFVAECRSLSDESFVFVPGFEVPYHDAHLLLFGCQTFLGQTASSVQAVQQWGEATAFTVLAHPVRNRFRLDEGVLNLMNGIEVWNQQYDGKLTPRFRSLAMAERERAERPLLVTGGLDFHREEHIGSPRTTVELDELSEQAILQSLRAGRYTFGSTTLSISAWEAWDPTIAERVTGIVSRLIIVVGKRVNATLRVLHLPRPVWLAKLVRKVI